MTKVVFDAYDTMTELTRLEANLYCFFKNFYPSISKIDDIDSHFMLIILLYSGNAHTITAVKSVESF